MAEEEKNSTSEGAAKEGAAKDFLSRLADRGEEAIGRMSDLPGAGRLAETVNGVRERMDDLQRRVRGIEGLERRVVELEERLDRLEGTATARPVSAEEAGPGV